MPTKDQEIAALKALLRQEQERAQKAEKRAEVAEKKISLAEKKTAVAEKKAVIAEKKAVIAQKKAVIAQKKADIAEKSLILARHISSALVMYLIACRDEVHKHHDFPEIQGDLWKEVMKEFLSEFENVTSYRVLARYVIKGSEKSGKVASPKALANEIARVDNEVKRSISTASKRIHSAVSITNAAAISASDEELEKPENQAAQRIANTSIPVEENGERKPSPGRQAVEKFDDAPEATTEVPSACPDCGSADYEVSEIRSQQLRELQMEFNDAVDHILVHERHGRCFACGKVHLILPKNTDIPVAPARTIGQGMAIAVGVLSAKGMPLNKCDNIFINDPDGQLGHSTLNDNVHDWGMQTGKVLSDAIANELKRQTTVTMDETPFNVLQSQGRGNCKLPEDARPRQKDYLAVQTSGSSEKHQCVHFTYLGGRKAQDIEKALDGFINEALITDAYAGYESYVRTKERVQHQCCCVHLRRILLDSISLSKLNDALLDDDDGSPESKVAKAIEKAKNGFKNGEPAYYVCSMISALQKIYGLEKWLKQKPGETREAWIERVRIHRGTTSTLLMDDIDAIMKHLAKSHVVEGDNSRFKAKNPQSLIGAAVCYYLNHRDNFRVFLTNPCVDPDSSSAERCIRAVTVLRKACDFKQSAEYMDSMCVYFTLVETAKMNGFNVKMTMEWLQDFGRAYYLHRADATLTDQVNNQGRKLESKLMNFTPQSAEGFDIEPWLPWNYLARRNKAA